jgi:hypothetical protein
MANISHWQQYPIQGMSAAVFATSNNGPIQGYWMFFSWATMGPFDDISSFSFGAHLMTLHL